MSAIAGLLLMVYGAVAAYVGYSELQHPHLLTQTVAYSTLGIGVALVLAGLAHFKAPHKAFLMSVPLLAYFHVQSVIDATFLYEDPKWLYQAGALVLSALILLLSYGGYKAKRAAALASV